MILEEAGHPKDTVFRTLEIYPDNAMKNLAAAASVVIKKQQLDEWTTEEFLHFFGTCFVRYTITHKAHYGKLIKVLYKYKY